RRTCARSREAPAWELAGRARPRRPRSRRRVAHRRQPAYPPCCNRTLERVHAERAEVRVTTAADFLQCLLEAAFLAVEALRRHRIESIGDVDDASGKRDLLSELPLGIAPTVHPLVVVADARDDLVEVAEPLDDPRALLRMAPHHDPLGRRERAF